MKPLELETALLRIKEAGRKALVPYFMGLWPDRAAFQELLAAAGRSGATAVEVGLPFTDPVADGPSIQAAGQAVLDRGATAERVFDAVAEVAPACRAPLVLMTYANPVLRAGASRFLARAADAGFQGLIVPDLPSIEAHDLRQQASLAGLALVGMAAPNTPAHRLERIARSARGFVYLVSVTGVTGARANLAVELDGVVAGLRRATDLPVYVGFGVSGPEAARRAARQADGVIVGSALIDRVRSNGRAPADAVGQLLRDMRVALDGERALERSPS